MVGKARRVGVLGAVVVLLTVLSACDQPLIEASVPVTTFGTNGAVAFDAGGATVRWATTPDGGMLIQNRTTYVLSRLDATGQPAVGWTNPTLAGVPDFIGGLPDGTVDVVTTESGARVFTRYSATGVRLAGSTIALPNTNFRYYGLSPFGYLATVSTSCAAGVACDGLIVDSFAPDGTKRFETTVSMAEGGAFPCAYNVGARAVMAHDEGTTTVATARCSTSGGSTSSKIVSRRLTATGAVDPTYDANTGITSTDGSGVRIVINDGGEYLVMGSSYALRRVAADGVPDSTFGSVSGLTLTGGKGISSIVSNGIGYTFSKDPTGPFCDPDGDTTVYHLNANGTVASSFTTPVSVAGAGLGRYANGDLVVSGVSQASQVVGTSTNCVAPRTYHFLKLTTPPAPTP